MKIKVVEELSKQEEKSHKSFLKRGEVFFSNLLRENGHRVDEDGDVVVLLGKKAIDGVMPGANLKADHGKVWEVEGVKYVPLYHPAKGVMNFDFAYKTIKDVEKLEDEVEQFGQDKQVQYELVSEDDAVGRLLLNYGEVGFDVESTSPTRGGTFQAHEANIVGASFSQDEGRGFYASLEEEGKINPGLAGVLESPLWTKVVAGGKFEWKTLKKMGVELYPFEDIQLAAALCGEDSVSLKVMGRQILSDDPTRIKEVWKDAGVKMEEADWDTARRVYEEHFQYGCTDSDNTLQLWSYFRERMESLELRELYEQVEKPLVPILARMEMEGVPFDREEAEKLGAEIDTIIYTTDVLLRVTVGEWLGDGGLTNTNSRAQKSDVLQSFGAPLTDTTPSGKQLKTDAATLSGIREWWPELVDGFLRLEKFVKLRGFITKWLELVDEEGYIHPSINQSGRGDDNGTGSVDNSPATGRLSASGPNVNQIPHHSDEEWGYKLRRCWRADEGWVIMACDAEQEEPRTVAVVAHDQTLIDAFAAGSDIYRAATVALYPYTDEDLSDAEWKVKWEHERYNGKTFFLAWYYGAGAGTLVRHVDSSLEQSTASQAVANLAKAHPARNQYLRQVEEEVVGNKGWAVDLFGRKRFIPKMLVRGNNFVFQEGLREAANFKIQGPCATILKQAMIKVDREIKRLGLRGRMLFPVHDELVLTCPVDEQWALAGIVQRAFQNPFVKLPISVQVGPTWGDMNAQA